MIVRRFDLYAIVRIALSNGYQCATALLASSWVVEDVEIFEYFRADRIAVELVDPRLGEASNVCS